VAVAQALALPGRGRLQEPRSKSRPAATLKVRKVDEPQPPQRSDAELVCAVLEGQTDAFGELVARYKNVVTTYVAARVAHSEVEDLAQEVFVRSFRVLETLRDPKAFGAWLLGIAHHVCVDWHRSRRDHVSLETHELEPAAAALPHRAPRPRPDEAAERNEAIAIVLESLDRLPEPYRVTLVLKHLDGLSCNEIAERMGVALGTVTSRLARAYKMLREHLDRAVGTQERP